MNQSSEWDRTFPPPSAIDPSLAAHGSLSGPARRILQLADDGVVPGGAINLSRGLRLRSRAFAAEMSGLKRPADFFWGEALDVLERLWASPETVAEEVGAVLCDSPDGGSAATAGFLARALLREVFLDTHLAILRGVPAADPRAGRHIAYARRLLKLGADDPRMQDTKAALRRFEVDWLNAVGRPQDALAAAKQAAREAQADARDPESPAADYAHYWATSVAGEIFARALSGLSSANDASAGRRDLACLDRAMTELEELRREHPEMMQAYQLLSDLSRIRAIKLALVNRNADAARAAIKAARYNPASAGAFDTLSQVHERIANLEAEVQRVEAQIQSSSNMAMSDEGKRLVRDVADARRALSASKSDKSDAALAEGYERAYGAWLWRQVRLRAASWTAPYAERVAALRRVVQAIPHDLPEPALAAAVAEGWRAEPALAEADPGPIEAFLRRMLYQRAPEAPAEAEAGAVRDPVPSLEDVTGDLTPIPPPKAWRNGIEPAKEWLASRQSRPHRAGLIAAGIAAIAALLAVGYDLWAETARTEPFEAMMRAAAESDSEAVRTASDRFLAVPNPVARWLRGHDQRDSTAEVLRAVSIDAENRAKRDAALAALEENLEAGRAEAALVAADAFRTAITDRVSDDRLARVEALERLARDYEARQARDAAVVAMMDALAAGRAEEAESEARRFLEHLTEHIEDPRVEDVREFILHAQDYDRRQRRDTADATMRAALLEGDFDAAVRAGEEFLNNLPKDIMDPREPQVRSRYEQAFLAWFLGADDALDPAIRSRFDAFANIGDGGASTARAPD
jgi:hypothetical protein